LQRRFVNTLFSIVGPVASTDVASKPDSPVEGEENSSGSKTGWGPMPS
jgi:hypothetical protein